MITPETLVRDCLVSFWYRTNLEKGFVPRTGYVERVESWGVMLRIPRDNAPALFRSFHIFNPDKCTGLTVIAPPKEGQEVWRTSDED
jgi:hypothetical protein